jgi:hypothetical protein
MSRSSAICSTTPVSSGRSSKKKGEPNAPPVVSQLVAAPEPDSCAFVALSAYSGTSHTDILRIVARLFPAQKAGEGLTTAQMLRVLRALGFRTKRSRVRAGSNLSKYQEVEVGLAIFQEHCSLLRRGLVFDPDLTVSPLQDWLSSHTKERLVEVWTPKA